MNHAKLPLSIAAGLLTAGAALHAWSAGPTTLRYEGLELKSDAGNDHLTVEAAVATRWGKGEAQFSAARSGAGALDGTTRAWWQSELRELDSSLRLGSQAAAATFLGSALEVTGLGLTGRLAPAVLEYALSVGRLDERAGGLPAATAWLQRKLGQQGTLALRALQVGNTLETSAALDTLGAWPGIGRWGLVQYTQGRTPAQTRLVSDQRLAVKGATLQARADRVVSGCAAPSGAGLAVQPASDGCLTVSADAAVDLVPSWQMKLGSSYKLRADDSVARQAFVGAVWQTRGLRLSVTLQQRAPAEGGQALGAALSYPLGFSF